MSFTNYLYNLSIFMLVIFPCLFAQALRYTVVLPINLEQRDYMTSKLLDISNPICKFNEIFFLI